MARVRVGAWMRVKAEGQNVQSEKPRAGQGIRTGMTKQQG